MKIDNSWIIEKDWSKFRGTPLQKQILMQKSKLLTRKKKYIRQLQMFYKIFDNPKGQKLLDVGCGYGFYLLEFANLGMEVTGIDFDKDHISMLNNLKDYFQLKLKANSGDACELPMAMRRLI